MKLKYLINKIETSLDGIKCKKYYKIIDLFYIHNMTKEEISIKLNISIATFKRIKKELLEEIGFIIAT